MAKWPLNPTKIWDVWKDATSAADSSAELVLAGDSRLVQAGRSRLSRADGSVQVWSGGPSEFRSASVGDDDVLVILAEPAQEDAWSEVLKRVRKGPAVIGVDDGPAADYEITWYSPKHYRVSFSDAPEGWERLYQAILDVSEDRLVALARRYPALRDEASLRIIRKTARQNALVGAAFFLPGTDFPVMTLNQIKMVLMLAVIHGEELTRERALELLGVVGAGFGFRAAARQGLAFVPGPGWALKGSVGYAGTYALGEAALRYFRDGAAAAGVLSRLTERFRKEVPAASGRFSGLAKRLKP